MYFSHCFSLRITLPWVANMLLLHIKEHCMTQLWFKSSLYIIDYIMINNWPSVVSTSFCDNMSSLLVAVINTKLCVHYRAGCVAATPTALLIARVCCCHPHSITYITRVCRCHPYCSTPFRVCHCHPYCMHFIGCVAATLVLPQGAPNNLYSHLLPQNMYFYLGPHS